ncbi:AraC family transcriptional regulator [Treponema zuelzerae]|uniref:AraC family transcriptional regulator n=1 Tax=Teretinema zuelzerae TaxID=156 RepID=A0AAE3JJ69_9SPIR|nr:AraC family transcriptional regulator [Teretinema zuelzerae]MCD1655076.1 AraC family transcriptional regulator [Teretinema zuelzerae]
MNAKEPKQSSTQRELSSFHMSWESEQELWNLVRRGDAESLRQRSPSFESWGIGRIAKTDVRQEKNLFIASVTLATRAAVEGGVPVEYAYTLSDEAINAAENLSTDDAVRDFKRKSLVDFALLVRRYRTPRPLSAEIARCVDYISKHLTEDITLDALAAAVNLSPTHVSRKFRRETGFAFTIWLRRERVREACRLMLHSSLAIPDIAAHLGFSSQSYFTVCFKRETGATPGRWLQEHRGV